MHCRRSARQIWNREWDVLIKDDIMARILYKGSMSNAMKCFRHIIPPCYVADQRLRSWNLLPLFPAVNSK